MSKAIFVILFLVLSQCTTKTSSEHRPGETWVRVSARDLAEKEQLTGTAFGIQKFYNTRKPFLVDGYLVVSDKAMDPPLHVIDVKERKWAYGLGVEGYGPGEVSYIWTLDYSSTPGRFWAYNFDKFFPSLPYRTVLPNLPKSR